MHDTEVAKLHKLNIDKEITPIFITALLIYINQYTQIAYLHFSVTPSVFNLIANQMKACRF